MQVDINEFKTLPQLGDTYKGETIKTVSFGKNGLFIECQTRAESLYSDLCNNAEGCSQIAADNSGVWRSVYLPNVSSSYEPKQFSALLSALAKSGLYEIVDNKYFGRVKITSSN